MKRHVNQDVIIDERPVTLSQIVAVARGNTGVKLSRERSFLERIRRSEAMLHTAINEGVPVYGVSTGYGKSCGKRLKRDQVKKHQGANPILFHGCGTGDPISVPATRAAMLCRLLCLSACL
jgi:histidine ammonia-lyase